ncbi:EAL domain-containing response regulator [Noviherbaspirillum galbum]|uniref:EAL domain-containing response regulator n=1 Tax=Noviherbaspirillum galbum TaxID=2709383 RepID=A0A6B3SN59_9BURK|nr:EAL domain-containing response regulator [Noviherbaspirillum galbum]NEX62330.1 EAL domain-containing response regulator [Noviherbaspirillum galbum]
MLSTRPWQRYRILVLEDNKFQRALLVTMLRSLGCEDILEATDGGQALSLIAADGVDVVVCDLQADEHASIDGVEFIRLVGRHQVGSLILVSALGSDLFSAVEMLANGHRISLAGCLPKPIRREHLVQVLERCMPRVTEPARHEHAERMSWSVQDLKSAIMKEQFVPYFQPKASLADGQVRGAEVLARWNHPEAGVLGPYHFIPVMEREGLIDLLTESLLHQALQASRTLAENGTPIKLAINASPLTLQDVGVPNRWRAIAMEHGVPPERIIIEVTETAVAENFIGLLETVTRLRMHGFGVALDDFGTCFSSLQQLSEFPITEVKIDRSFVMRAPATPRGHMIFESILALSHRLGLDTVAEGIETREQLDFVTSAGCTTAQGFLIAKPSSFATLRTLLADIPAPQATQAV